MNTCRICGKEIGKTYSDKKLRCSSCRKSVENAIGYNERTVEYVEDELFAWKAEYKKLKKENRKLSEKIRFLEQCLDRKEKVNKSLREELSVYDREYFDEDKKAKNIFTEEGTLQ